MKIKLKNYARQLWLSLLLMVGVAAIAVPGLNGTNSGNVAQIGNTEYETLQEAFYVAKNGQTVTLLDDVDATGNMYAGDTRYNLWVKSDITVDGDGHTLTVKGRGIGVKGASGNIDVTFKNITVKNVGNANGRCIDTRGNVNSLTLNNTTLTTAESSYTGYLQPLTIGGNQATPTAVNITKSNIITVDNAKKGYAITTFNPVNLIIDESTLKGWACLNLKGADNSAGSKGSIVTVTNSTLVSANGTPGYSNAYSLIKIEDDNINVDITGSTVNVNGGGNTQSIVSFQKLDLSSCDNCTVSMGDGNNVILEGDYKFSSDEGSTSKLSITGGTFNSDPSAYLSDGYKVVENNNGTWTVREIEYVAQIGNKKYTTLQGAFNDANDEDVVELLKDYDASAENNGNYPGSTNRNLWLAKGVTVDGNGYTLTVTNRGIGVQGASDNIDVVFKDITIKNSSASGRCIDTRGKIGSLTLDNATLSTDGKEASQPLTIGGNQADAATVKILNGSTVATSEDGKYGYAITTFNPVNMTVDGSTLKGWACFNIKAASSSAGSNGSVFTITNSELTSKNVYAGTSNAYSVIKVEDVDVTVNITNTKINVDGDKNSEAIVGFQTSNTKESVVNMGEGNEVTFTGTTDFAHNDNAASKLLISGGIFNQPVPEQNCAEGMIPSDLGDGKYSVKVGSYAAKINEKKYETLEAAFAAAQDGETITLLADCTGNGIKAPQGKFTTGLTVDFAGHTYTVDGTTVGSTGTETNGFQLLKDNKITFKGGTITSEKAKILVQNYSDLTLEGMTLTLDNANYTSAYTLSNNNGNVVIDGTTINANPAGGFAFDVCRYESYPSVNVTVKGESVINGNIEVFASNKDPKDGFGLTLEAGTFNGNIVLDASAEAVLNATPEKAVIKKSNSLTTVVAPQDYKWKDNGDGTSTLVPCEYVAQYNNMKFETLQAALDAAEADNPQDIVIDLLGDATLDITAWSGTKNPLAIGTESTKSITINGNNHTLTFNQKNSDWNNVATMNDAETKLILNDMALTSSGYNNGPWNRHDINFNCAVELNNVTSDKALAFKNDATLKNVTVTDTSGSLYGIWIQPNGQNVSIDGLTITAERGIKIDDQYVEDNPGKVTLDIANATFNTTKKSAILVKSAAETVINAGEGINIENVAKDKVNLVWVDEDRAEEFYKVTIEGATIMPESNESDYVACLMKGEQRWGFYKVLSKAIDNVEDGYSIKLHQTTTEAVEVSKQLTITKNEFTADNVTAGEGYKRFESETEIVIRSFNPICAIGDNKYETLAEAVAAAGTSEATITLLTEAATDGVISGAGVVVPSGSNITFDLNGLTYNVSGETVGSSTTETQGFQLLKNSNITFKNGTLKATSPTAQMVIQNYSNLTLEDVNVDGTGLSGWAYALSNNCGTINLTGSTSITAKEGGRAFDTCKFGDYAIPTVNINTTGVISGPIEATGGKLNIENGKFDVTWVTDSHYAAGDIQITGGVFTEKPVEEYCAEGYIPTTNNDEATKADYPYAVKVGTFICAIGDNKYETLAEAVAAAGTSEATITLLTEAATDGVISGAGVVVPSGSNITFDLNGLTYNVSGETVGSSTTETQGFQLLKNSNITFKNGTLKATSPTAQMVIQNYSNLTLEDVNVDGTGLSGWAYALSNNCGTINLTGSTSITAKEGGRAFDTCKFGDYAIPTVNINTTGVISGPIEATGGKLNIENGKFDVTWVTDSHYAAGDIQITGGVFTEKPAEEYCAEGYVPTFNTDPETKADYPYAVKSKDDDVYELIDAENYPFMDLPSDITVSSVTYKRSFSSTQVGKHQAWFVPMDYTITADDAANFTFYKIQMIAGAAEAGEADHDKIYLYIEPMNEGEVLKGNRPYTVKPKNVVTDYEFTAENTTLYAPTTKSRLNVTTSFHSYDFYGKYANDPYTGSIGDWFSLAQGSLHSNPASTTFRQYRWIIKVTANTINDDYSKIEFSIVEDGDATGIDRTRVINSDDVEGIYTTNGMKVDEPVRGINIIRYKNGKTEKIIVK